MTSKCKSWLLQPLCPIINAALDSSDKVSPEVHSVISVGSPAEAENSTSNTAPEPPSITAPLKENPNNPKLKRINTLISQLESKINRI